MTDRKPTGDWEFKPEDFESLETEMPDPAFTFWHKMGKSVAASIANKANIKVQPILDRLELTEKKLDLLTRNSTALFADYSDLQTRAKRLEEVLRHLHDAVCRTDTASVGIFTVAAFHHCPYKGPHHGDELQAAFDVLNEKAWLEKHPNGDVLCTGTKPPQWIEPIE